MAWPADSKRAKSEQENLTADETKKLQRKVIS